MPWDGSGSFTRSNGTQTGATTWANSRDAGNNILASQHDTHDQDLADGIGACITQNNESKPTADFLPNANASYDLGATGTRWRHGFFSGNLDASGNLTLGGQVIVTGDLSPSQITGNQDDYNPTSLSGASRLRLSSDARRNTTGLQGGADGRRITIHNVGTFPIVFKFEDASSTAANRFAFGHTLSGGHSMSIEYDGTTSRWRCTFKEDPAGTIKDFGGGTVPDGHLACDGSNVSRTTYASLFNEVSTTWGVGDGSTAFGVPDSRRRAAVGSGGSGSATLSNTVGSTGGAETHTLTEAQMPSHAHEEVFLGLTGALNTFDNAATGNGAATNSANVSTGAAGGGQAHNIMQPSFVVTKIIKF